MLNTVQGARVELVSSHAPTQPIEYAQGLQLFGDEQLKASDWMAIQQAEQDAQADRMVVLSDVWLDKPDVLDSLHTIFAGILAS